MTCAKCGGEMRRSQRSSLISYWRGCLCVFPYRCKYCKEQVNKIHWEQATAFYSVLAALFLVLATGGGLYVLKHKSQSQARAARPVSLEARLPDGTVAGDSGQGPKLTIRLENILSNQDIVDLNKAKLRADVITRLIRTTPHNFRVDPKSLIALKESGAPDDVIAALIEVTTPISSSADAPVIAGLQQPPPVL